MSSCASTNPVRSSPVDWSTRNLSRRNDARRRVTTSHALLTPTHLDRSRLAATGPSRTSSTIPACPLRNRPEHVTSYRPTCAGPASTDHPDDPSPANAGLAAPHRLSPPCLVRAYPALSHQLDFAYRIQPAHLDGPGRSCTTLAPSVLADTPIRHKPRRSVPGPIDMSSLTPPRPRWPRLVEPTHLVSPARCPTSLARSTARCCARPSLSSRLAMASLTPAVPHTSTVRPLTQRDWPSQPEPSRTTSTGPTGPDPAPSDQATPTSLVRACHCSTARLLNPTSAISPQADYPRHHEAPHLTPNPLDYPSPPGATQSAPPRRPIPCPPCPALVDCTSHRQFCTRQRSPGRLPEPKPSVPHPPAAARPDDPHRYDPDLPLTTRQSCP
jgi:hypothetical protein